jgi:exodeoxyribonuclease VII large subunit
MRAPTPSAAAEIAVYEYQAVKTLLEETKIRFSRSLFQKTHLERMKLERFRLKMNYLHPRNKLREKQQNSLEMEQRLKVGMEKKLQHVRQEFALRIERMKGASPFAKLNQGFSYVSSTDGNVVKSIASVQREEQLKIYVTDGVILTRVEDTIKEDYDVRKDVGNII